MSLAVTPAMRCLPVLLVAISPISIALASAPAAAQAPGTPATAAPAPAALPAVAVAPEAPRPRRFSLGLRLTGMSVASTATPEDELGLAGAGLAARYRFARRWSAELSIDHVQSDPEKSGVERHSVPVTLGVAFHITPHNPRWDWTVRAGVGASRTTVSTKDSDLEFAEGIGYLGAGVERKFRRFGVGIDLRALAMARNDELDGAQFGEDEDGPVPAQSTAGQFTLYGTWYF